MIKFWGNVKLINSSVHFLVQKILQIVGNAELPLIPSIGSCLPSTCSDNEIFQIVTGLLATVNLVPVTTFCSVDEPLKLGSGAIATM